MIGLALKINYETEINNFWHPSTKSSYHTVNPGSVMYTPEIKYSPPYYISPIEIGLLWAKITYLKSHSKALAFDLRTDTK